MPQENFVLTPRDGKEKHIISKLSRIRNSFFAAIREGDKMKASELAKRYNSKVNRFLKTFQSSPQITQMYLGKVKSTFRIAENLSAGDNVSKSHDAEEVVEVNPVSQADKKEMKEFTSYQLPVSQSNTEVCVSTDIPLQADSILPLVTSSMVGAQTNGASENPDSTQGNDPDPHADNDDNRVKKELKELTSYQEPVPQSNVEDCRSPDMPPQADSILPLAMSPIVANMTSNTSEDVNDGNCLDVNASKDDELHMTRKKLMG